MLESVARMHSGKYRPCNISENIEFLRKNPGRERIDCTPAVLVSSSSLTFKYGNGDGGLIIAGRGKDLTSLGRNGRVSVDEFGHHAPYRLDSQRQRIHVQQNDIVLTFTR